jgi:hypothetical protein
MNGHFRTNQASNRPKDTFSATNKSLTRGKKSSAQELLFQLVTACQQSVRLLELYLMPAQNPPCTIRYA